MSSSRTLAPAVGALAALLGFAVYACDNTPAPFSPDRARLQPNAPESSHSANHASHALTSDELQQLAALRQLTTPFHDFEQAKAAGWSTQITPCLANLPVGTMGFHYGNTKYIDGVANLLEPELLMYEPEPNGRLRFVGVEYIIPLSAWNSPNPPTLLGQQFHVNSAFGVWALHVWLWRENPSGIFSDWNPKVSCAAA